MTFYQSPPYRLPTAAVCGLILLVGLIVTALLAPILAPYPLEVRFSPFLSPSAAHILGCDDIGHDILSQLVFASRVSLLVGITAAMASVIIGAGVGLLAGYITGWPMFFLQGCINIFLLIPALPLMIALAAYLGPSMSNIILIISVLGWCSTARVVQARVLQLKTLPFIEALIVLGIPQHRIIFHHILPNTVDVLSAKFILSVAQAMLSEAALSFLGLGDPVQLSWGGILYYAFHRGGFANDLWNWYLPPGLCIALAALGFMLLGFTLESTARQTTSPQVAEASIHAA